MQDMKNNNAKEPLNEKRAADNKALLDSLSRADIVLSHPDKRKRNANGFLRSFFMFVFALVFVASAFNIVISSVSRSKTDKFYEGLRDAFYSGDISQDGTDYLAREIMAADTRLVNDDGTVFTHTSGTLSMKEKYELMLPNLDALASLNANAFAWIKVDGTRVDYPIVKGNDNSYYLDHALDRTYSVSGSVFIDYMNSKKLSQNRNTCVYGHNMNDGTMFQTIMNFKNKNQFKNGKIEIYTKEGIYVYTPFAAYESDPYFYFFYTEFPTDEYFSQFLSDIKEKSMHESDITPTATDKIVTLITCTNTVEDKRCVVHGVLDEIIK